MQEAKVRTKVQDPIWKTVKSKELEAQGPEFNLQDLKKNL
jgi:hypothetical protein